MNDDFYNGFDLKDLCEYVDLSPTPFVILSPVFENNSIIDFVYEFVNKASAVSNKIPKEEFLHERLLKIFPIHSTNGVFNNLVKVFTSGTPWSQSVYYVGPSGSAEMSGYYILSAAKAENNLVVSWTEITDLKLIENNLRESEEKFSKTFMLSPAALVISTLDGIIVDSNELFVQLVGMPRQEIIGNSYSELNILNNELAEQLIHLIRDRGNIKDYIINLIDKNGNTRIFNFAGWTLTINGIPHMLSSFYEITRQMNMQEKLSRSLSEKEQLLQDKELLIKESHHRIKNNLQLVSSLIRLQTSFSNKADTEFLKLIETRIYSISLLHEHLYRNISLSRVNLKNYISELVNYLESSNKHYYQQINIIMNLDDVEMKTDSAINIGLIVNELVTNALKHAFKGKESGEIFIGLKQHSEKLILTISDNGIGMDPDVFCGESVTLGLQLVNTLLQQLKAELNVENNEGTRIIITI